MVAAKHAFGQTAVDGFLQAPAQEQGVAPYQPEAITHLQREIQAGRPWPEALLEAIGLWSATHETVDGQDLVYLIGGEAFDWLTLASRLLAEVPDAVSHEEKDRLLFHGELPPQVTESDFREALGFSKYRAHLNYFYGVVVEEALWLAVECEVLKERGVRGVQHGLGVHNLVCQRLYGADQDALIRKFRRAQGRKLSVKFTLGDWKDFTYWLFKQRLARCDSARVASDTRKGLQVLQQLRGQAHPSTCETVVSPQLGTVQA